MIDEIYIYGAGHYGLKCIEKIEKEGFGSKIVAVVDRFTSETRLKDYDIVRPEIMNNKDATIVIALADVVEAQKVAISLIRERFDNIFFLDESLFPADLRMFNCNGDFSAYLIHISDYKPVLSYLEFQVADNCNLNCKACAHFSNLVKVQKCANQIQFNDDINCLSKLFSNIITIRLMGGEPLLNKELPLFASCARKAFPYAEIRIVTNGILIPKMSKDDMDTYRSLGIIFDISQYPPIVDKLHSYTSILKNNGIKYKIGPLCDKFFVNLSKGGKEDYIVSYNEKCISKRCHFLRNGKLFACPRIPMAYEQMYELGFDFSEKEYTDSGANIYGAKSGWEILDLLYKPVPMCRICAEKKLVPWEMSGKEIDVEAFFV